MRRPNSLTSLVSDRRRWWQRALAVALCCVAVALGLRDTTKPPESPLATPLPQPDFTATLAANQRAVSVGVTARAVFLLRAGDVVDLLGMQSSDVSSETPHGRLIAASVRVLAVDGSPDPTCPDRSASPNSLARTQLSADDTAQIAVAVTPEQALSITSFAAATVLVSLHPRK